MDAVIVKVLGYLLGLLLGGSLLTLIVRVTLFVAKLDARLETTADTLKEFMKSATATLEEHRHSIEELKFGPRAVGTFEPPREVRR